MKSITVGITSYNYGSFIIETIESILAQNMRNIEILVYDDCSTDDSVERIEQAFGHKVTILRGKINRGQGFARNNLIQHASGEFIFFLDSDDVMASGALAELSKEADGYDVIFGMVDSFSEGYGNYQRHKYLNDGVKKYRKNRSIFLLAQLMSPWNKMLRVSFLREKNVKFSEHRVMEDALFAQSLAFSFPRVNIIDHKILYIRHHSGSLSHYGCISHILELMEATNELIEHSKKLTLYSHIRLSGNNLVYYLLNNHANPRVFRDILSCKNKLPFYYRFLIVLKLIIISKKIIYLKMI